MSPGQKGWAQPASPLLNVIVFPADQDYGEYKLENAC